MRCQVAGLIFDSESRRLTRGSEGVHLEPKAFDLLALLVERHPAAVAKREIHDRLWPATFVSDSSLATVAAELRAAIGDALRTVRAFGYALEGDVTLLETQPSRAAAFLVWNDRPLPLAEGQHVVGRDPAAEVLVEAPGVSRRHAVVSVLPEGCFVEDLESKNGTFLDGARVTGRAVLADAARIGLGHHVVLVFRRVAPPAPTETELP